MVNHTLRECLRLMIRQTLSEAINVAADPKSPGTWQVTFTGSTDGGNTENGFGFMAPGKPYIKGTSNRQQVLAPIQVAQSFAGAYSKNIPEFSPEDVVEAIKLGNASEHNMVIEPGIQEKLAQKFGGRAASWITEKVDIVTCPQSRSQLASIFATVIAQKLGAKFVPAGVVKQLKNAQFDPEKLSKMSPTTQKSVTRGLERMKADPTPSIRKYVKPAFRSAVQNWQAANDSIIDVALGGDSKMYNVIIVDDVVTTGSTFQEAAKALEDLGMFKVVGMLALFKMQDSR